PEPVVEKQLELVVDQPAATETAPAEPVAETPAPADEVTETAEPPAEAAADDKAAAKAKVVKKRVYRRTTGIRKITKKK
ncbi:MAG: hypothetical protein IJU61_07510, partial [Victivallales bacterium]|nr:hypothetical protein [Victivallales bacterium]